MSDDARRYASIAFAVVGAVLALAGGFALYAREEIFEPKSFARHASDSLKDERVRTALTDPIVNQVVDNGPDQLINARPLLVTAVDQAIGSGPFRDLFRKGAIQVYRALFSKDRDQIFLTIDDIDTVVADAAGSVSPSLGRKVPRDFGEKLVRITDNRALIRIAETSQDVRLLGLLLPFFALGSLIGSVLLAPDRRQGFMVAAGSVAVAAVIGLIALLTARSLVLSNFDSDVTRDAVRAVWDAYFGGLRTWTMVVGICALVLSAAAASARRVDPEAPAKRILEFFGREPTTNWGRAGRALGFALLGLFIVLEPDLALDVAAVLLGAYALFYASCEAMSLIAPPKERQLKLKAPSGRQMLIGAGVAIAAAALAFGTLALFGGDGARAVKRPPGPVTHCNGYEELCDKRLNEIAFGATHNAMSAARLPGWFTPNQRFGIEQQLRDGVRVFLIDSHYGIKRKSGPVMTDFSREDEGKVIEEVQNQFGTEAAERIRRLSTNFNKRGGQGKPGVYFCHVVCELGSTPAQTELGWFRDFLETHPDEVIVLFIEDAVSPEDTAREFADAGLLRYMWVQRQNEPLPTLRQMIETDRRLFVMAEKDNGAGQYPWYHDGFDLAQETPYTFHSRGELADFVLSCAPNRGTDGSVFQMNNWIEKLPRSPSMARQVNDFDFLSKRAAACQKIRQLLPNIIAVDWYDEGQLLEVAQVLNGLERGEKPTYRTTDAD